MGGLGDGTVNGAASQRGCPRTGAPRHRPRNTLGSSLPMKAVILCGGRGTRMGGPLPKAMIEVGGRPLLWHIMKIYSHFGVHDFTLCLGYGGDVIRQYCVQYPLFRRDITVELGSGQITTHSTCHDEATWRVCLAETGDATMTGGRLKRVQKYLLDEQTFLLTYADAVSTIDIGELVAFHRREGRIATVTAVRPKPRFGEIQVDGNRALTFREKPHGEDRWISGGFFVFERQIFDVLGGDECVLEKGPLSSLADAGALAVYRHDGYWQCMDTPADLQTLNGAWTSAAEAPWAVWARGPVGV
jgi:glucose-1-phosphate cytidylyltransferase